MIVVGRQSVKPERYVHVIQLRCVSVFARLYYGLKVVRSISQINPNYPKLSEHKWLTKH